MSAGPAPLPTSIHDLDWTTVPSACFVVDTRLLARNAAILGRVKRESGAKVLLALKGFSMWKAFAPFQAELDGCCASGPIEAMLAHDKFGKELHTYAPAFSDQDLAEVLPLTDHLVFNSPGQLARHLPTVRACGRHIEVGMRVNPEYAEVDVDLYNPCARGSRLGSTRAVLGKTLPAGIDGLHFHALCEQGADVFVRVLAAFEQNFGDWLPQVTWLNCGGGHWITKPDYDTALLIHTVRDLKSRYPHLTVYLEPGEASAVDTGVLLATVQDIHQNQDVPLALLDISATCHMPDVLEMPYRPTIGLADGRSNVLAGAAGEQPHTYRLGGPTCLAGDVLGDWSFPRALVPGDRLVFHDMSHYTMVKTTMFNGVKHPNLALWDGKTLDVVRRFGYADFRDRLS